MKNTQLTWRTEKRKINSLTPCVENPRTISKKELNDLKKSIKKSGYVEIIAIDVDGRILAGNQRHLALMEMGMGDVEVDVRAPSRKLTKEEFDRYLIASNATGGDWDFEKLKLFDLDELVDIGLDRSELQNIWAENLEVENDDFDDQKELSKIKIPKTKRGDLIALGSHRIYCGDSTNPISLERLFGKERASIVYSDPVYNLRGGVDYNKGIGGHANYGGNVNDNRTDDEYKTFIRKSIECALSVTKNDAHIFYWCDESYIWVAQTLYRELGIQNKRVCLWIKNGQNPTPNIAFNKCYEPCVYGVIGKPFISNNLKNLNEVMNKEITTGNNLLEETLDHLDVWMVKRLSGKDYSHATSKPAKLHEKAIRRCTRPREIILDSFLGSGSTLIAAEQLKRRVYGIELEPVFCDLVIKRYERLTGKKAKLIHHYEEK